MSSRFVLSAQLAIQPPAPTDINKVINNINNQLKGIKPVSLFNSNSVQGAAKVNKSLQSVGSNAKKAASGISILGTSFSRLGKEALIFSAAWSAINFAKNGMSSAIRDAVGFEKQMNRIKQVTGDTDKELGMLSKTIQKLSEFSGTSSLELAKLSVTLGQAGIRGAGLAAALEAINQTSLASTFGSVGDTAEGLIAILNQFNKSALESGEVLGSINQLSKQYAAESTDFIEAARRGGSAFTAAGGSLNEFLGSVTAVRANTRLAAESIGVAFKTLSARIQDDKTVAFFKTLGVQLRDTNDNFIGMYPALERIAQVLATLPEGSRDVNKALQALGGKRQRNVVLALVKNFKDVREATESAKTGVNSLKEDALTGAKTMQAAIGRLKTSFDALGRTILADTSILHTAINVIQDTVNVMNQMVTVTEQGFAAVSRFNKAIGLAGAETIALGVGAGLVVTALLNMIPAIGLVNAGLGGLILGLAVMANASERIGGEGASRMETFASGMAKAVIQAALLYKGLQLIMAGTAKIKSFNLSNSVAGGAGGSLAAFTSNPAGNAAASTGGLLGQAKGLGGKALEKLGTAAISAGAGLIGATLAVEFFDAALGKSTQLLKQYNDQLKNGTAEGAAEAQEDIDNFNLNKVLGVITGVLTAAIVTVAASFTAIPAAIAGAVAAFVYMLLSLTGFGTAVANSVRDVLAWTGILSSSSGELRLLATAASRAAQSQKELAKSTEQYNDYLKNNSNDGDSPDQIFQTRLTAFTKAFGDNAADMQQAADDFKQGGSYGKKYDFRDDRIRKLKSGETDPDGKIGKERRSLSTRQLEALNKLEALDEALEDTVGDIFNSLSEGAAFTGMGFDELFDGLAPELQAYIVDKGKDTFEAIFDNVRDGVEESTRTKLRKAISRRVEIETEFNDALRARLGVMFEAREIEAEYGGRAFTPKDRTDALLNQLNAGDSVSGVRGANSINPRDLAARMQDINNELTKVAIELGDPGTTDDRATELKTRQEQLLSLSEGADKTNRALINEKKRELDLIKKLNVAEAKRLQIATDAADAALRGDFTKIFQSQRTQGTVAALASGSQNVGQTFGTSALADAIDYLKGIKESGGEQVFGANIDQLIGNAYGQGLNALGITNPDIARDAAGPDRSNEEVIKRELVGLARILPITSDANVTAANIQLQAARIQEKAADARAKTAGVDVGDVARFATGGPVGFAKRGTDTMPAMLTPGEFVVRRSAVQRGNNLNMLRAMNGGDNSKSMGGTVYASGGGSAPSNSNGMGFDFASINKAANSMESVSKSMKEMITKLGQLKLNVTLAPTTHNVNLTGTAALQAMSDEIKNKVIEYVGETLRASKVSEGGSIDSQVAQSNLPSIF